jgi:hypothetical protein
LLQAKARKTKGIQIKKLAFPWIPLAESGLFNELRRIQIKKSATLPKTRPGCKKQAHRLVEAVGIRTPAAFVHGPMLTAISALRKQMSRLGVDRAAKRPSLVTPLSRAAAAPSSSAY